MSSGDYPSLKSILQRQINAMQDAMVPPCKVLGKAMTIRAEQVVADWANKPNFDFTVTERKGEIALILSLTYDPCYSTAFPPASQAVNRTPGRLPHPPASPAPEGRAPNWIDGPLCSSMP